MSRLLDPVQFLVIAIAGWMNQRQLQAIEYLREENRILRGQHGDGRVRFNEDQRRRLAVRAKGLGRKLLAEVASLVTPDTLARCEYGLQVVQQSQLPSQHHGELAASEVGQLQV